MLQISSDILYSQKNKNKNADLSLVFKTHFQFRKLLSTIINFLVIALGKKWKKLKMQILV